MPTQAQQQIIKAIGETFARSFTFNSLTLWISNIIPQRNNGTVNYFVFLGHVIRVLLPPLSKCRNRKEVAACASRIIPLLLSKYEIDTLSQSVGCLTGDLAHHHLSAGGEFGNAETSLKGAGVWVDLLDLYGQYLETLKK